MPLPRATAASTPPKASKNAALISRLIGSPQGYVDSDLGGQLTEAVKKQAG